MRKSMVYYTVWYKKEQIGQTDEMLDEDANTDENIAARQKIIDDHAAANELDPTSISYRMRKETNDPVVG